MSEIFIARNNDKHNALGSIVIFCNQPTYSKGKGKWERGVVIGHAPNYMYPELKNGECIKCVGKETYTE